MLLSTQTDVASSRFGEEKCIRWICEAGFDAIDYSMFTMDNEDCPLLGSDFEKYVLAHKAIAESYGKFFNQAHAPFRNMMPGDEELNKKIFAKIKRSIEISGILGIKNLVVHPSDFGVPSEENLKRNAEFYNQFIPLCKEYNVKIAVENMFGHDRLRGWIAPNICSVGEEFRRMMEMLDPDCFTACVDIGHAGLVGGTAQDMIRALGGDYLTCLHVHDNDFRSDKHFPPYFFKIDWDEVTQALADIDYKGELTFEADRYFDHFPEDLMLPAYKFLNEIGRSLIRQIEEKKATAVAIREGRAIANDITATGYNNMADLRASLE